MRLDRFISSQMPEISRSEVKKLCKKGLVAVDGVSARDSDLKIDPESSRIELCGRSVLYKKHLYIMLNKPAGVVSATRDGISSTVLELLPANLRRQGLFPAGRLDKDTEGFVLITDDGELAHKMLSPKSHVPKLYFVELDRSLPDGAQKMFSQGIELENGEKCLPAELRTASAPSQCYLTLHEGKFHQVKRMFSAIGANVVYLKRIMIGGLELDPALAPGESRELSAKEKELLLLR